MLVVVATLAAGAFIAALVRVTNRIEAEFANEKRRGR